MGVDARTEDVGGENNGAVGLSLARDVGPESPWKIADDLAGLAATQSQVRRVVEALRMLSFS